MRTIRRIFYLTQGLRPTSKRPVKTENSPCSLSYFIWSKQYCMYHSKHSFLLVILKKNYSSLYGSKYTRHFSNTKRKNSYYCTYLPASRAAPVPRFRNNDMLLSLYVTSIFELFCNSAPSNINHRHQQQQNHLTKQRNNRVTRSVHPLQY